MPGISNLPRNEDGTLPAYAWPGAYDIVYYDNAGDVLCATCANEVDQNNKKFKRVWNEISKVHNELDQAKDRVDRCQSALEVLDPDLFDADIVDCKDIVFKIEEVARSLNKEYIQFQITEGRKITDYDTSDGFEDRIYCADCLKTIYDPEE